VEERGKVPRAQAPPTDVVFSFRFLDTTSNPKFSLGDCEDGYFEILLERLLKESARATAA
jgi:hypothetical protein